MTRLNFEAIVRPFEKVSTLPAAPVAVRAADDLGALAPIDFSCGIAPDLSDPRSNVLVRAVPDRVGDGFPIYTFTYGAFGSSDILRDFEEDIEEEEEEDRPDIHMREISRETTTVRITNPEDSEQYVDVEDAVTSTIENPQGQKYVYHWLPRTSV